jgi:hypothetical protein
MNQMLHWLIVMTTMSNELDLIVSQSQAMKRAA